MRKMLAALIMAGVSSSLLVADVRAEESKSPSVAFVMPVPSVRTGTACTRLSPQSARELQQAVEARLKESRITARVLSYCARHEKGDDEADISTVPIVTDRWMTYSILSCAAPLAQTSWSCGRAVAVSNVLTRRLQWVHAIDVGQRQAITVVDMLDGSRLSVPGCLSDSKAKRELGVTNDFTVQSVTHLTGDSGITARVREGDDLELLIHFKVADSADATALPTLDCYSVAAKTNS
jgi:hypothetical protein